MKDDQIPPPRGPQPSLLDLTAYLEAQGALHHVRIMHRVLDRMAELPREAIRDFTLVQMTYMEVVREELEPDALLLAEAIIELEKAYPDVRPSTDERS